MKKYIKPAIEEHAMGATMFLQVISDNPEVGSSDYEFAPGKKGKDYDDEDDNGFSAGW